MQGAQDLLLCRRLDVQLRDDVPHCTAMTASTVSFQMTLRVLLLCHLSETEYLDKPAVIRVRISVCRDPDDEYAWPTWQTRKRLCVLVSPKHNGWLPCNRRYYRNIGHVLPTNPMSVTAFTPVHKY